MLTLYLLTIGFISILGQVVILRELNVAFYGVELIYILAMGIWLFWTALGALIGRRAYVPSVRAVRYALLLFGGVMPLSVALTRAIRLLFRGITGTYLPFGQQLAALFLILFPVAILTGLTFQWAAKLYITQKRKPLALAYAVESAGGLAGGLAATLLLQQGMQNFTLALLCGGAAAGSLLVPCKDTKDRIPWLAGPALGVLMTGMLLSPAMDHKMTAWTHPHLIATRDSPYGRLTISGRSGQFVVFENDTLGFETESTTAEEFVHMAALQTALPRQVLISGGGVEGLVAEVLKHAPRYVDYVELNAVLLTMAERHLPERSATSFEAGEVTVHHADPRQFLETASRYDLMLVGMPEPASGASNRFYTREYFEACARHLSPDGVLAFRLRSSENLWTRLLGFRNTSIYLALKSVFRDAVVLPGGTNTVIASQSSLIRDPAKLIRRFERREIRTRLITPDYIRYLYTNDRFSRIARLLMATRAVPNTDIHPVCYQYAGMIWLSKFIPGIINRDLSSFAKKSDVPLSLIFCTGGIVCLIGLFLLARRRDNWRKILLVIVAGFAGMVLETMLVLYYQAKSGALFQNIGILLMVFMAGLAAGSVAVTELSHIDNARFGVVRKGIGHYLLISFGILGLIFINLLYTGYPSGIVTISVLLFGTGFLVSGLFAFASLSGITDQKRVVSPLYAADLMGGCMGSVLGSLFLIPFWGMGWTSLLVVILVFAALLLI